MSPPSVPHDTRTGNPLSCSDLLLNPALTFHDWGSKHYKDGSPKYEIFFLTTAPNQNFTAQFKGTNHKHEF